MKPRCHGILVAAALLLSLWGCSKQPTITVTSVRPVGTSQTEIKGTVAFGRHPGWYLTTYVNGRMKSRQSVGPSERSFLFVIDRKPVVDNPSQARYGELGRITSCVSPGAEIRLTQGQGAPLVELVDALDQRWEVRAELDGQP